VIDDYSRYLVTHLMASNLTDIVKTQKLTDEHIQFLVYQILRGLKVSNCLQSDTQHFNTILLIGITRVA